MPLDSRIFPCRDWRFLTTKERPFFLDSANPVSILHTVIDFDSGTSSFEEFLKRVEQRSKETRTRTRSAIRFSPRDYEQPVMTKETHERIKELSRISAEIERNLVKVEDSEACLEKLRINYKKSLNLSQYKAATTVNGPLLVIAGAGSGKTRTLIYRVAYLIESGVKPGEILLLTFTRKAAAEMITRASELLGDLSVNGITGGTFHSFANHILRRYSGLLGIPADFTIADTTDSEDIVDLVRKELHIEKHKKAFPRKSRLVEIISRSRNCSLSIAEVVEQDYSGLAEFTKEIELVTKGYGEYKRANRILDFDDLMEFLQDSLETNPRFLERIQSIYRYVMVDEFQDTNTVQKKIADLVASRDRNIMVVGDDSQSIYSFRGANFENILRFPETYPDCRYIKLEQNYRSSQDILDFTNSLINKAQIGYKKSLFSTKTRQGKPEVRRLFDEEAEAEFIVDRILEQRERGIPLNQIAVLYRASHHGNFVQAELLKRKIPYVVYGGIRFVERRHVKDMIAYLKILENPYDAISWNRVLNLIPGIGSMTASKIVEHVHEAHGGFGFEKFAGKKYSSGLEELGRVLSLASTDGSSITQKIEILERYYAPILETIEDDADIRLRDLDVLIELAGRYEELEKFLSDFALDPPSKKFQDKTTPRIDEREDREVILSTVHSAKGLEWRTVFVVHLLDGLFPNARSIASVEELEEERRLFYVACTRAKESLVMTYPASVSSWDAFFTLPSRFLAEIESDKYSQA